MTSKDEISRASLEQKELMESSLVPQPVKLQSGKTQDFQFQMEKQLSMRKDEPESEVSPVQEPYRQSSVVEVQKQLEDKVEAPIKQHKHQDSN